MTDLELPIDLFRGWPSPDLLPVALLQQATNSVLSQSIASTACLNYGPDEGPISLRREMAAFLSQFYSTSWTAPSRLSITSGASQALACILQVYTDPVYTRNVYMVAPTYFLACRVFEDNGFAGKLRAVPEDNEGIDLGQLELQLRQNNKQEKPCEPRHIKRPLSTQKIYRNVIYCVPTFSNPSGKTMTQKRREQLVRLARDHDALIIADDVYDFLQWSSGQTHTAVVPRLVDIDHILDGGPISEFGNVVSNGSFSKILGPGLRTGWTESTPSFANGLVDCGSTRSGGPPSHFVACVIAEMLRTGSLQTHLFEGLCGKLEHRSHIVLEAIEKWLVAHGVRCSVSMPRSDSRPQKPAALTYQGGYYIYIQFPTQVDVPTLAKHAELDENLILACGENFEVKGDEVSVSCTTTMRICIAWESEERLSHGIQRLGEMLRRISARAP